MNVDYEHCGKTVLIEDEATELEEPLWIEGESDFERSDPVRDIRGVTKGILSEGMLLDDLVKAANSMSGKNKNKSEKSDGDGDSEEGEGEGGEESSSGGSVFDQVGAVASRLRKVDMSDLTSLVGIDRTYSSRELELAQSFLKGESLAHHMEDSYYLAMGRAVGFNTTVGEEIVRV